MAKKLADPPAGNPFTRELAGDEKDYLLRLARQYHMECEPPEGRGVDDIIKEVGGLAKLSKANPLDIMRDWLADKDVTPVPMATVETHHDEADLVARDIAAGHKPEPVGVNGSVSITHSLPAREIPLSVPCAARSSTKPTGPGTNTAIVQSFGDDSDFGLQETGVDAQPNIADMERGMQFAIAQFNLIQKYKASLLGPDDTWEVVDKKTNKKTRAVKKTGWRKIAAGMRVTIEMVSEERRSDADRITWKFIVRATARDGRSMIGVGMAQSLEAGTPHAQFPLAEHAVYALAQTRATNRAISDLVGGGEVSAEEIDSE